MPSKRKSRSARTEDTPESTGRRSKRVNSSAVVESNSIAKEEDNVSETQCLGSTSKRKSRSSRTEDAPESSSRRSERVNSSEVVESASVVKEEDNVSETSCLESISVTDSVDVKTNIPVKKENRTHKKKNKISSQTVRDLIPADEAKRRWPHRYQNDTDAEARCHFAQAEVDGEVFYLEDDAYVQGDPKNYICKIKEIFEAVDGTHQFSAQWFYRSSETVIKACGNLIDSKCIFYSEIKNDNPIECLVKKLRIAFIPLKAEPDVKENLISTCDYYYDKIYLLPYSSFVSLQEDGFSYNTESDSADLSTITPEQSKVEVDNCEKTLLDLYSGCGGMSTGLSLGANNCGVKLVTKWAVDFNEYACESLRLNHPETQVRNESADDFLLLLKEWERLCAIYISTENKCPVTEEESLSETEDPQSNNSGEEDDASEIYEVDEILEICYGDPNGQESPALHFKIRWLGYGPEADTWEPLDGLSCQEKLKEFVVRGYNSKILPLPGSVDVICGGPPCQGISGFNRFRNKEAPLEDPKNKQLLVYMDIVAHLRPRFILMENVVDILRFSHGFLGRYALGSLVSMGYQARMGLMAAGAYGLPQFRMRMFMWGALPEERLPQYPLPTHDVVVRGNVPTEFELNAVAFEEGCHPNNLKDKLFLIDAISDLPHVENSEKRDAMEYTFEAKTEFQRFIRLRKNEMPGSLVCKSNVLDHPLFDHRPLPLNEDDHERVCRVPKKKGANFRDFPGVKVGPKNKVEWDTSIERVLLTSGKPLVPDYAMTYVNGTSSKPFGRLWWDETVPTVVTRAEPHNQVILHPSQDRVLTVRENARLQGFPDYYKFIGPIKERYTQVGNAVAVPVGRALGFSLALAFKGSSGKEPTFTLPQNYQ